MPVPDFSNEAVFPTFRGCPITTQDVPDGEWFLLGQVKQNMTITKPTVIVTDRSGVDFAITFEDRGIDLKPVKKGWTVVVPNGRRTQPEDGKKGFVKVPEGLGTGVKYLPGGLEKVFEVGRKRREAVTEGTCESCGETKDSLMKCTGCGGVRYCSKACQVKDWGDGHKSDCKVLKAMAVAWGA